MILSTHGFVASSIGQFDADAQAFFDRVTTAGGSLSATEKTAVNTLVIQMKADGIWMKMKAIYPMVGASADACKQNLKSSSFTGTFSSGWTFASTGAKPNGTSAYFDTNLNWNTNTDLNNASFGAYWTDYVPTATSKYYGGYDASGIALINQNSNGSENYINSFNAVNATKINGLHGISRINSTEIVFYRNSLTPINATSASSSKYQGNMWFAGVSGNTQFGYQQWNIAFGYISEGFNSTEWGNFYTAVQSFQTTLSRQV